MLERDAASDRLVPQNLMSAELMFSGDSRRIDLQVGRKLSHCSQLPNGPTYRFSL